MSKKGYSFGTFQGGFVPSLLTILGVIMYLRFGWVLGNAGLVPTLITVEQYRLYFKRLIDRISALPATALVMASEDIEFEQLFIK